VISSPTDTRPEAGEVQRALLRAAGPSRRAATALSLSRTVCALARRAILAAHPGISDDELIERFVEAHYGSALAARVRTDLARRRP